MHQDEHKNRLKYTHTHIYKCHSQWAKSKDKEKIFIVAMGGEKKRNNAYRTKLRIAENFLSEENRGSYFFYSERRK